MRILHTVESYLPARHGMAEVVRQISERLAQKGHKVTVATSYDPNRTETSINGVEIAQFAVGGKEVIGIWGDRESYQDFLRSCGADIIVNFAAQQWATDLMLPIIEELDCAKVMVPTGFSGLHDHRYSRYFAKMPEIMSRYDACIYLSNSYQDAVWAKHQGLTNGILIPNGASEEEFDQPLEQEWRKRHGIDKDDLVIIHVAGYLSRQKGQLDAVRLVDKAGLRSTTLLVICPEFQKRKNRNLDLISLGRIAYSNLQQVFRLQLPIKLALALREHQNPNRTSSIRCLGLDRQDIIQAFLTADLLLFPSRVECSPLVLFEAAASGTPFLATPAGNSEEIATWLGNGLILPSRRHENKMNSVEVLINPGARLLSQLASDHELRRFLGSRGKEQWKTKYTWAQIADQYEELYLSLIKS